jgi:Tfp pilus assembly protein PilO
VEQTNKQGFLQRLNDRERKLLVIWAISMSFMVLFLGGWWSWSSITEKADAAEKYQLTLDYIASHQQEFLANSAKEEGASVEERIDKNDIKLQSYLDREATRSNLKISNFKESVAPLGGKKSRDDAGGIVEESLTINVDDAAFKDLARFMDTLARSKELLVIKRIDLERARRFKTEGTFKMTMTVSTYKKGSS